MSMNRKIGEAVKAGTKDAQARLVTKNTALDGAPNPALPRYGLIFDGYLMESELQLTRERVDWWAARVWATRVKLGLEHGTMPDNWIGIYVLGTALTLILESNNPTS